MPVSDYNTTASNNKAISGINIDEGCPPGNVNDAIRQMMADLAAYNANVTGGTIIAGSAAKATKLATARTIGISGGATGTATGFDGSANITIPVTALDVSKANAGTLPVGRGGTGLTAAPSVLTNLASTTAASILAASPRPGVTGVLPVANGGTGNNSGNVAGNANTATKLATARTITINPAATAAASFDGSANVSPGVAPTLTDGTAASTLPTAGTATALTTLLNTIRNCLKWLVARFDSSGNANAAVKWVTARTIAISGAVTGTATSINGTANITIPTTALDVSKATAGTLPVTRGGTGQTTLAAVRNALIALGGLTDADLIKIGIPAVVRAWARIGTDGTIKAGYGIAAVAAQSTAVKIVTLQTAAPSTNYSVVASGTRATNNNIIVQEGENNLARTKTQFAIATQTPAQSGFSGEFNFIVIY